MVILRRFYEIVERDTSDVSCCWKGVHIASLLTIFVSGFMTAYTFGKATESFGDNCLLFPNITFDYKPGVEIPPNASQPRLLPPYLREIDYKNTEWGSQKLCNFCEFAPLMSMIFSFVWAGLFSMCGKGGAGYSSDLLIRPWRIVYPAIVFSVVSTVIIFISTVKLNDGIKAFCAEFEMELGIRSCSKRIDEYTLLIYKEKRTAYVYLKIAISSSYVILFASIALLVTLILRVMCLVDFQLSVVTMSEKLDEVEQIVIEPEEKFVSKQEPPDEESIASASVADEKETVVSDNSDDNELQERHNLRSYARLLYY